MRARAARMGRTMDFMVRMEGGGQGVEAAEKKHPEFNIMNIDYVICRGWLNFSSDDMHHYFPVAH
jgi:hypothetical protein